MGIDWCWSSFQFWMLIPIFLTDLFALLLYYIQWDHSCSETMDDIFCESQWCLFLKSRPHLGTHMYVSVLHSRAVGHPIYDPSGVIATRQFDALTVPWTHYVSNNCAYFQSHCFNCCNKPNCNRFSHHERPIFSSASAASDNLPFVLLWSRWLCNDFTFYILQKICHMKYSLKFISTFGRNISLSLEYLSQHFNTNINQGEAARHIHITSSLNNAHPAWMHGTLWNAIF